MRCFIRTMLCFAVLLTASTLFAADYNICVRLGVTVVDQTNMPNEIGTSSPRWKGRGILVEKVTYNGNPLFNFPRNADRNTGCFVINLDTRETTTVKVFIRSQGIVGKNNEIFVHGHGGTPSLYAQTLVLPPEGGTFEVVFPERIFLRLYALMAFTINNRFQGRYDDERLRVFWYPDSATGKATACQKDCTECAGAGPNDTGQICISDSRDQRKFLLVHEYGHLNYRYALPTKVLGKNDCNLAAGPPDAGDPGWHGMKTLEYNSCAVSEGWAHFVAADTWNDRIHDGGDPAGWFRYWGPDAIFSVEAGTGGCGHANGTDWRRGYADNCWCASGDCDGTAVELDWLRTFWDYHTDDDLPGFRPNHSELHNDLEDSGGWGKKNAWDKIYGGLAGEQKARMLEAAWWNGTSEP